MRIEWFVVVIFDTCDTYVIVEYSILNSVCWNCMNGKLFG